MNAEYAKMVAEKDMWVIKYHEVCDERDRLRSALEETIQVWNKEVSHGTDIWGEMAAQISKLRSFRIKSEGDE